jgi:hypothetical protein
VRALGGTDLRQVRPGKRHVQMSVARSAICSLLRYVAWSPNRVPMSYPACQRGDTLLCFWGCRREKALRAVSPAPERPGLPAVEAEPTAPSSPGGTAPMDVDGRPERGAGAYGQAPAPDAGAAAVKAERGEPAVEGGGMGGAGHDRAGAAGGAASQADAAVVKSEPGEGAGALKEAAAARRALRVAPAPGRLLVARPTPSALPSSVLAGWLLAPSHDAGLRV